MFAGATVSPFAGIVKAGALTQHFAKASRISRTVNEYELGNAQLKVLSEMASSYCIGANKVYENTMNVAIALKQLLGAYEEILAFINEYKDATMTRRLLKSKDFNSKVEICVWQVYRSCRSIKMDETLAVANFLDKLPVGRTKDNADLLRMLKQINTEEAANNTAVVAFLEANRLTERNAMDTLRVIRDRHDFEISQEVSKILNVVQRRITSNMPAVPWIIKRREITVGDLLSDSPISTTHKATWNDKVVAVKFFDTATSFGAFQEEVQVWVDLRHRNILEIIGANWHELPSFTVSAFCQYGDLRAYLTKFPNANRLKLAADVVTGLAYLHSQDIVHGELKASAVLVDDDCIAKLTDFDLVTIKMRSITSNGILMTPNPRWLSPECITTGISNINGDIYSLGVTIWEIFAEQKPYLGLSESGAKRCIMSGQTLDINPIPFGIRKFIQDCWTKTPSARPTSSILSECFSPFQFGDNHLSADTETAVAAVFNRSPHHIESVPEAVVIQPVETSTESSSASESVTTSPIFEGTSQMHPDNRIPSVSKFSAFKTWVKKSKRSKA